MHNFSPKPIQPPLGLNYYPYQRPLISRWLVLQRGRPGGFCRRLWLSPIVLIYLGLFFVGTSINTWAGSSSIDQYLAQSSKAIKCWNLQKIVLKRNWRWKCMNFGCHDSWEPDDINMVSDTKRNWRSKCMHFWCDDSWEPDDIIWLVIPRKSFEACVEEDDFHNTFEYSKFVTIQ